MGKGSRVNVVGSLSNNNHDKDGVTVYGFDFTAEEIDYLESRGEREARSRATAATQPPPAQPESKAKGKGRAAKPGAAVTDKAYGDSDVAF